VRRPGRADGCSPDDGAAAVEFALVIPLLLLICFGIISFGILFSQQLTLNAAAREGARRAIVNEVNANRTCQGIATSVQSKAQGLAMNASAIKVRITQDGFSSSSACAPGFTTSYASSGANVPCKGSYNTSTNASGNLVVETQYASSLPASFPPWPSTITLQSKSVFRCEFAS
jgi:Flp pilus assembly protein TadG